MAEERIGFEDLFAPDFVKPAIDQLNELLNTIETLEKTLKERLKNELAELAQNIAKIKTAQDLNAKAVREVAQATNEVAKSGEKLKNVSNLQKRLQKQVDDFTKALKDEADTVKNLALELDGLKDRYKELIRAGEREKELQEALQKAVYDSYESYLDLANTYEVLSRALQDLLASGKGSEEEFLKLSEAVRKVETRLKSIDESVGQFQRNVGDYRRSILESFALIAAGSSETSQKIAGLGAIVADAAVRAFQAAGGFQNFGRALVATGRAIRTVGIIVALEALLYLLEKIREYFSTETKLRIEELTARKVLLENELRINSAIFELEKRRTQIEGDAVEQVKERLKIDALIVAKQRELLYVQIQNLDTLIGIKQKAIEEADKADERLQAEADLLELRLQLAELTKKDAELASQRRNIEAQLLSLYENTRKEALALLPQLEQALATKAEQITREFEKQKEEIRKAREEGERLLQGDPVGLEQLRRQSEQLLQIATANFRIARSQLIEEQLAQIQNFFSQYAEISAEYAKIIADFEFETRKQALQQIQNELKAIDALTDERLELLNKLRELNIAQRDAAIFEQQLKAIEQTNEAEKIAIEQRIRSLQLQALERKRLLREELTDTEQIRQKEAEIEAELQKKIIEIRQEFLQKQLQIEESFLKQLEQRRAEFGTGLPTALDTQIAQSQKRIRELQTSLEDFNIQLAQLSLDAADRARELAQKELERRLREQEELAKRQAERLKKQIEEIQKLSDQTLNAVSKLAEKASEKRREALENESKQLDKTLDILVARAQAGSLAAEQSIAQVLARQKEIENIQRELRRQDQRRQLLLTALQAYTAAISRGSQQPLLDTVRDLTALSQIVQSLPTFYAGSEYINNQNALKIPNFARDAYLVRVHEGERIVPAHINKQLGNIKNEDLPKLQTIEFDYDKFRDVLVYVSKKANKITKKYDRL